MKKENKAIIEMLLCAALWSIAGIFIKLIPWNSFAISGMRSLFAGITILAYIVIKGYKIIVNRQTLLAGFLMGLLYISFVGANKLTTAANAIVLQFTAPLFVVVFSAVFLKQKIKRNDLIAVLVALAGISMFFLDKLESGYVIGNLIAIFAGACFASVFILVGEQKGEERFSTLLIAQIFVFLVGLPFVVATKPDFSGLPLLYIIILGVFQLGIPYILYAKATDYCPPLACSMLSAVEPLLNPVWVAVFDGEKPGIYALIGGIIVIVTVTVWLAYGSKKVEEDHA